jgi:hypothetical protein
VLEERLQRGSGNESVVCRGLLFMASLPIVTAYTGLLLRYISRFGLALKEMRDIHFRKKQHADCDPLPYLSLPLQPPLPDPLPFTRAKDQSDERSTWDEQLVDKPPARYLPLSEERSRCHFYESTYTVS